MDTKYNLNYRHERFNLFTINGDMRYNYEREGLLTRCMPKILFKGNALLKTFMQIIETRIIMLMRYVDRLNEFKHITKYY